MTEIKCPKCRGNGKHWSGFTCDLCRGKGNISIEKAERFNDLIAKMWIKHD